MTVIAGLKAAAVVRRLTHNDTLIQTQKTGVDWTYQYHGASSGNIIADERSDGLEPFAGSELCSAVEAIYSLSYLYSALGDPSYADRAELAAFNALPSMMTPDWWAHQYMAQTNQPYAINFTKSPFYNVNTLGATFGLEPNYPCCTVNHPQGLPKFTMGAFLRSGDNGLVHALLSPTTAVANLTVGTVTVECDTSYPFGDTLSYTVTAPGPFDFYIRQPEWSTDTATTAISGAASSYDAATGLRQVSLPGGTAHFTYTLAPTIRTTPRANDTIAVYRGALLYGLHVGSSNSSGPPKSYNAQTPLPGQPAAARDYEYTNTTAWDFAIDPATLAWVPGAPTLPTPVFADDALLGSLTAQACRINWPLYNGATPSAPPTGPARSCVAPPQQVTLVPVGGAKVHMAELPTLSLS